MGTKGVGSKANIRELQWKDAGLESSMPRPTSKIKLISPTLQALLQQREEQYHPLLYVQES